jgi:hypothetical protein
MRIFGTGETPRAFPVENSARLQGAANGQQEKPRHREPELILGQDGNGEEKSDQGEKGERERDHEHGFGRLV